MTKIMTEEEHRKYIHLCGKTGEELDALQGSCSDCPVKVKVECLRSHSVVGVDAERRFAAEQAGIDIVAIYEKTLAQEED